MDNQFVHLHNHSYFSVLDGLASPEDLVNGAVEMGYKALALTDHGSCAGLYRFQKYCKTKGVLPILGSEAYICDNYRIKEKNEAGKNYHIVLLAKNEVGYKNIIYLSSFANIEGFYYKPRISLDVLEKHKEGLIVTSACPHGELSMHLWDKNYKKAMDVAGRYKDIFGDDFYIEIMTHEYYLNSKQEAKEKELAKFLYKMAKKLNSKVICTQDTHYVKKSDWEAHDVLLSIQTRDVIKNPKRLTMGSKDFYLKSYEEMAQKYHKTPELLKNTLEIMEKIDKSDLIIENEDLLPSIEIPSGMTEESYLKSLVTNGMKSKKFMGKKDYCERIRFEMSVITKCNYTKYFLMLWDIVNFARSNKIRMGVGRGSAVGSLCLYVLDVTRVDPMIYGLLFERFLNPDRISPPDVDLDFDYDRRGEVYNYIISKYGTERCCQIGTYNQFKAKAVIRGCVKALDLGQDWERTQAAREKNPGKKIEPSKESLNLADSISKLISMKPGVTIASEMKSNEQFKQQILKHSKLLYCAEKIEGTISSGGTHPAGILVCKEPIITKIPMRNSKGVICSQYDGSEVENLGLLKFDLLALKTLTVIDKTLQMVKERHGKDIDVDNLIPNDKKVFDMLNGKNPKVNVKGVFQFEADKISQLLKQIRVDSFEDMIVTNALYRPGPLMAGVHTMYCDYKHGRKKIEYLHPKMGEVLDKSYGIMVYQEDIMKVSRILADFTAGQADTLRKAVGKKKKELLMEQRKLFIEGCIKNGINRDIASKIFEQIDYFGGYGFNRCLSGDTLVFNKSNGKTYDLDTLSKKIFDKDSLDKHIENKPIILDSYVDGETIDDELVDVFETGEKELHEVKLSNGMIVKCTLDHKFYCIDGNEHTVKAILEKDLEIICESKNMPKCKIISIKSLGKQKTYNLTMKGNQHNYKIVDGKGNGIFSMNSHSAAYAFIAYQCSWLKVYYPVEFMCNLLTSEINNNDKGIKLDLYFKSANSMGLKIYRTNLNKSGYAFKIEKFQDKETGKEIEIIRSPMTILDGVGEKAVRNIVENQPFTNLDDFIARTDQRIVNSRVFKQLVKAGTMDDAIPGNREFLMSSYDDVKKKVDAEKKKKKKEEKLIQESKENKTKNTLWGDAMFGMSSDNIKI